jgi:hypothetical protein
LQSQFLGELRIIGTLAIVFWLHANKGMYCLTSDIVCASNDGSFGNSLVENKG